VGSVTKKPEREVNQLILAIVDWQNFFVDPDSPGCIASTRIILPSIVKLVEELPL